METLRDPQPGGETESNHQRMQPFIPIEVVILSGIDQIKSTHPTNDSKGKDERRQFQPSCLRDPSRDRRNPEGETQKEVRCVSKMFGERIEKNDAKRDRRKRERQPIDICSKKNKKGAAEDETNENDVPGREKMTVLCPWIALINLPISEAIEKHRRRAGRDHTSQDQQHDLGSGPPVGRNDQGSEREGQSENGMRKTNEPKKSGERAAAILRDGEIMKHILLTHKLSNASSRSRARIMMGFPWAKKIREKSRSSSLRSDRIICFWLVQYFRGNKVKPCGSKLMSASPTISVPASSG